MSIKSYILKQLLKDDMAWVDYNRFLSFIADRVIYPANSITKEYNTDIQQSASYPLEPYIQRQSGRAYNQIAELISNAIDAVNPEGGIGRFGMGFKQVLRELETSKDRIMVISKTKQNELATVICFKKNAQNCIQFTDFKLTPQELGELYSPNKTPESMTEIIVHRSLGEEEQAQLQALIQQKFGRCTSAPIYVNTVLQNNFHHVVDLTNLPVQPNPNILPVQISIDDFGYIVTDHGSGMNDPIIYRHLLKVRNSTKTPGKSEGSLCYTPRLPDNNSPCEIQLMLAGIVIETLSVDNQQLPQTIMINFPQQTSISSSRENMIFDAVALTELDRLSNQIIDSPLHLKEKVSLINGVVLLCTDVINSRRVTTAQEIHQVQGLIRNIQSRLAKGHLPLLDSQIFLPHIPGISYLDIGEKEPIYLDMALFSEILIQKIPGAQFITHFIPGKVIYHAFTAPFKVIQNPSLQQPICFYVGSSIIVDTLIYQQHLQKPFQVAALNQLNNVWIGSAYESDIPKSNGYFMTPLSPLLSLNPLPTEMNQTYFSMDELFKVLSDSTQNADAQNAHVAELGRGSQEVGDNALKNGSLEDQTEVRELILRRQETTYQQIPEAVVISAQHVDVPRLVGRLQEVLKSEPLPKSIMMHDDLDSLREKVNHIFPEITEVESPQDRVRYKLRNYLLTSINNHLYSDELIPLFIDFNEKYYADAENLKTQLNYLYALLNLLMFNIKKIHDVNSYLILIKNAITLSMSNSYHLLGIFSINQELDMSLEKNACHLIQIAQLKKLNEYRALNSEGIYQEKKMRFIRNYIWLNGDLGLGDQLQNPLVYSAIIDLGPAIIQLDLGNKCSKEILERMIPTDQIEIVTQQYPVNFWKEFWGVAIRQNLLELQSPDAFREKLSHLYTLYKNETIRNFLTQENREKSIEELYNENKLLMSQPQRNDAVFFSEFTKTHHINPESLTCIEQVINSKIAANSASYDITQYILKIWHWGTMGLEKETFAHPLVQETIYQLPFDDLQKLYSSGVMSNLQTFTYPVIQSALATIRHMNKPLWNTMLEQKLLPQLAIPITNSDDPNLISNIDLSWHGIHLDLLSVEPTLLIGSMKNYLHLYLKFTDHLTHHKMQQPLHDINWALTAEQLTFLAEGIPQHAHGYRHSYFAFFIKYGNLGLNTKQFNKPAIQAFIQSTLSLSEAQTLINNGFINAKWIKQILTIKEFENQTPGWWIQAYGSIFVQWASRLKNKTDFDFATYNHRKILAKLINQGASITDLNLHVPDCLASPLSTHASYQISSDQIITIQQVIDPKNGVFKYEDIRNYWHYFIHHGNFGMASLNLKAFHLGLLQLQNIFISWLQKKIIDEALLLQLEGQSTTKINLFWSLLGKVAMDVDKKHFDIIQERIYNLCFKTNLGDNQIQELTSFKTNLQLQSFTLNQHNTTNPQRLLNLLNQDTLRIPNALFRLVEYYLVFGYNVPDSWLNSLPHQIGILCLGYHFVWYAKQSYLSGEHSLLNIFEQEKYQAKKPDWIARYWQFYALIQPIISKPNVIARFEQWQERWLMLCELGDDLSTMLLDYLKNPALLNQLADDLADPDVIFNQFIRFLNDDVIAPIPRRQTTLTLNEPMPTAAISSPISLTLLLLARGSQLLPREIRLQDLQSIMQQKQSELPALDHQCLLKELRDLIKSVIASQSGQTGLWLRELIQNSHDAILTGQQKQGNIVPEIRIDIEQYYSPTPESDSYDFSIEVSDSAGMDLHDMINYLLYPGSSNPEKRELSLLGEFGIGFYTIFIEADQVEIKTSRGEALYQIAIQVQRDETGQLLDLVLKHLIEMPNPERYKGTTIRRIKHYAANEQIQGHLMGLCLTQQINYFVGGLLAPITTHSHGHEIPITRDRNIIMTYNQMTLSQSDRELLASVPIKGMDDLRLYRQTNQHTNRVEHAGLFVSGLGPKWMSQIPAAYQDELGPGLIIMLPPQAKLNSDRSGLCHEQVELFQITFFVLYLQAILKMCLQKDHQIKALPRDFYEFINSGYSTIEKSVREMRDSINQRLNPKNINFYGDWDDFPTEDLAIFHHRLLAINLLSQVQEKQQVSLANIVNKDIESLDLCDAFKSRIQAAISFCEYEKNASPQRILNPDEWTPTQHILNHLIQEIYKQTGLGFSKVVFFEKKNGAVIAYVQRSTGMLIDHDDDISYPIYIEVTNELYQIREAYLLERNYESLIFDRDATNFIRTLAHETAHTLEFKRTLQPAFQMLETYQWEHPNTISESLMIELKRIMRRHFVTNETNETNIYLKLDAMTSETIPIENRLPVDLMNLIAGWAFSLSSQDQGCGWTHNADEKIEDSFINLMTQVLRTWVKSGILARFDLIIEQAMAKYLPENVPEAIDNAPIKLQPQFGRFFTATSMPDEPQQAKNMTNNHEPESAK